MKGKDKPSKNRTMFETIGIGVAILVVAFLLYKHTPYIIKYLVNDDVDGLTDYIRTAGALGAVVLIGVQVIETISIVLPALPVYICAGILYGKIKGILLCYITNILINGAMFMFARRNDTGENTVSDENTAVDRQKNSSRIQKILAFVKQMKNPMLATICMCLIPVVPNGMIPTIASRTSISLRNFMTAIAVGCLPAIAFNVICGDLLLTVDWSFSVPLVIIIAILAAIAVIFRKQLDAWLQPKLNKMEQKLNKKLQND